MREQWPALSRIYGLRPWDVDRLTLGEIESYAQDLTQIIEQANEGR